MTERIGRRWTRGVIAGWGILAALAGVVIWVSAFVFSFLEEGPGGNQRIDEDWSASDALGFATFFGLGVFLLIIALAIWHRTVRRRRIKYDAVSQELISGRQRIKARQIDVLDYGGNGLLTIYFIQPDGSDTPLRPWKVDEITDAQWSTVLTLYRVANEEPPGRTREEAANEVPARRYAADQADLLWSSTYAADGSEWNRALDHALRRWIRDPGNIDLEKGLEWIRAQDAWDDEDASDSAEGAATVGDGDARDARIAELVAEAERRSGSSATGVTVNRSTTVTRTTTEYRQDGDGRWVEGETTTETERS